ncbi:MAG: hypothetical protein J6U68_03875, partial [Clostridia bacterium]|nr:hypothetical protein [Clostridia bacterium]
MKRFIRSVSLILIIITLASSIASCANQGLDGVTDENQGSDHATLDGSDGNDSEDQSENDANDEEKIEIDYDNTLNNDTMTEEEKA